MGILELFYATLAAIGGFVLRFCRLTGRVSFFTSRSVLGIFKPPYYWAQIKRQFLDIGYYSLPVVGLTAIFVGAALALQSYSGFSRFSAESSIPMVTALAIVRELGPVLGSLMVAGRVSASIAAEIGTMRVTEQIYALQTLSTSPFQYLMAPRILAATLMMPVLVGVADIIGIYGGYLVCTLKLGFNPGAYLNNTFNFIQVMDVVSGLIKAAVFGFIIALMGCYHGYHSRGGAAGVGAATTYAVVSSSILILLFNYILTEAFFI